jgi:phosphatidate cytidylyltransferase
MSNFYLRTISTIFIFPPVLYAVWSGDILYFALVCLIILLSGYEWNNICGRWTLSLDGMVMITFMMLAATSFYMSKFYIAISFVLIGSYLTYLLAKIRSKSEVAHIIPSFLNRPKWLALGSLYLGLGFSSMAFLGSIDPYGITIIWVFLATVCNDVFAYIFGSIIKGKKIAPSISPGKSWSGFMAAAISTSILTYIFAVYLSSKHDIFLIIVGLFIAFFAHLGDMLESAFKRYIGIKDTSNLIPGHGGILDRVDAIIMVSIFIAVLGLILGKSPLFY